MCILLPPFVIIMIVTAFLSFEAVSDLETGELDMEILALSFSLGFVWLIFNGTTNWFDSIVGLILGFIPFFLVAYFGHAGGGDALLLGAVGALVGGYIMAYMIVFSFIFYFIQGCVSAILHRNDEDYKALKASFPFAPHVWMAWITCLTLGLIQGGF